MANRLVLSIFPGLGLLDRAFEADGFTVVRGPDVIWGGDIRTFYPPSGVFDGVIGGDPCQSHSLLANLVRANGNEPKLPDMTPEYLRIIEQAQPRWFLRENTPLAPPLSPAGYRVTDFRLCNSWLDAGDAFGEEQMRKRRFWFGVRGDDAAPNLMIWIKQAAFVLPDLASSVNGRGHSVMGTPVRTRRAAVTSDARETPVARNGSGKIKSKLRHAGPGEETPGNQHRLTIPEMLELQGLPSDLLDHCPFTAAGKRQAIGNGVPQAMGRAIARAVRCALDARANDSVTLV